MATRPSSFWRRIAIASVTLCFSMWETSSWAGPVPASGKAGPEHVTYVTEDYPPSNYLENGSLKGYAVDLLKAAWAQMNVAEQPIQVIPWARGYNMLETRPNVMLFATMRTAAREDKFHWVGPIYRTSYVLVGLDKRDLMVDTVADVAAYRIGVVRDDAGQGYMRDLGIADAKLDKAVDPRILLKLLASGRLDLICVSADTIPSLIAAGDTNATLVKTLRSVGATESYYAFSKATDIELVERFQKALNQIEPERKRLLKAAGFAP